MIVDWIVRPAIVLIAVWLCWQTFKANQRDKQSRRDEQQERIWRTVRR